MEPGRRNKVMVAMSGGVDSSIAAMLLLEEGYDVVGVTMQVTERRGYTEDIGKTGEKAAEEAAKIAEKLGIPHYSVDLRKEFRENVIEYFKNEYLHGRTPNPCAICNPLIKWDTLWKYATEWNVNYMATGHYAETGYDGERYFISKGKDITKDQSYMLWGLNQQNIARTILPLGKFSKDEIKRLANEKGFHELTQKKESFEICFIPEDDYRGFLRKEIPGLDQKIGKGEIVNKEGKVLGRHRGFPFYTIGQRRGLEIALGEPVYVNKIDARNNRIMVGDGDELYSKGMIVEKYNPVKHKITEDGLELIVKVRYQHKGVKAWVIKSGDVLNVNFAEPVSAVTPGQSAVFYNGEHVAGGGIIREAF